MGYKSELQFVENLLKNHRLKIRYISAETSVGTPTTELGLHDILNYSYDESAVFDGLVKYGFLDEATELANKTLLLFGADIEKHGEMHEYYNPDTGEGINNPGFQNWNLLALNMIEWLNEGKAKK